MVLTNCSMIKGVKGGAGGGWFKEGGTNKGRVLVGPKVTVWDAEIVEIKGALNIVSKAHIVILANYRAPL